MCAQEILGQMEFMFLSLKIPKPFFLYLFSLPFKTSISKIIEAFFPRSWSMHVDDRENQNLSEMKLSNAESLDSCHVCVFS